MCALILHILCFTESEEHTLASALSFYTVYKLHQYWQTGELQWVFFCSISRNFQLLIISAIKNRCTRLVIFLHLNRVNLITQIFFIFQIPNRNMVVQQLIWKPVVYIQGQWIRQLGQGGPSRKKKEWTPPPKKKGGDGKLEQTGPTSDRKRERKALTLRVKKTTKMFWKLILVVQTDISQSPIDLMYWTFDINIISCKTRAIFPFSICTECKFKSLFLDLVIHQKRMYNIALFQLMQCFIHLSK